MANNQSSRPQNNRGAQPVKNSTPRTNERNQNFPRGNTQKHQYENKEEVTNDENYDLNNPEGTNIDFDLRDKSNNLEDHEHNT